MKHHYKVEPYGVGLGSIGLRERKEAGHGSLSVPWLRAFWDLLVRAHRRERPDRRVRRRVRARVRQASASVEPEARRYRCPGVACQAALRCEPPPPLTWLRGTAINTSPPPRLPRLLEREALPPRCERLPPDFAPDLAPVLRRERVLDDAVPRRPVDRVCGRPFAWVRLPERAPLRAVLLRADVFFAPVVRERLLVPREAVVRRPRVDELRVDAAPRLEVERRFELDARVPVRLVERAVVRRPEDELREVAPRDPVLPLREPALELRERAFVLRDEVPREPD